MIRDEQGPGDAGMSWRMEIQALLRPNRTGMCWGSRNLGSMDGVEELRKNRRKYRKRCALDHEDAPARSLSDLIVNYH